MRSFTLGKSRHIDFGYGLLNSNGRHGVKFQQNGADRRIELFFCDVKGVLQIRWFSGCQCCPTGFPPFDFGFKTK
jgi:hypothetical protein